MLALAIGISCTVLVSQCLGAGWPSVAEKATKKCLTIAVSVASIVALSLFFGRSFLLSLYTSDETVIRIGFSLILFGILYHVFDAMQCVSSFALRGYRVTFWPMVIYGVLLWGVGLFGLATTWPSLANPFSTPLAAVRLLGHDSPWALLGRSCTCRNCALCCPNPY